MRKKRQTNEENRVLVEHIATRAAGILKHAGRSRDLAQIILDITAAHAVCPLDLQALAEARDLDLAHDVFGIEQHLDRTGLVLRNGFTPRHALANRAAREV